MHLFGRCLNHDDSSPMLDPIIIVWTLYAILLWMSSSPKACDWTLLGMETENCFLNHSKPNTWAHQRCICMINIKGQKLTRCMPSKCKPRPFQANTKWSYGSSSSHFIIIKVQAHQASSILDGPRRSKWPNFASLHIWFATSWLSLKFFCLFHVFMFLWIPKFHVAFNELFLCIYIKTKKN